jgi:hypothetical protein
MSWLAFRWTVRKVAASYQRNKALRQTRILKLYCSRQASSSLRIGEEGIFSISQRGTNFGIIEFEESKKYKIKFETHKLQGSHPMPCIATQ